MKTTIVYAISKYITYGLKFLQALVIAKYLGPSGLAILGFAQLISLYVSFLHFGIPLSVHTLLSISKNEEAEKAQGYISDAFWFLLVSGVFFCVCGWAALFAFPDLFEKFQFQRYGIWSIIMGINIFIVVFFSNIYQVYGQFVRVAVIELASILILFVALFMFKSDESQLIYWFLLISSLSILPNLFFFLYKAPFKIHFQLRAQALSVLIKIGLPMLISNVGFYLITISVRSITSYFYTLHEIGLFTFALSIANAVMLGLNAVSWTFYSIILANTSGPIDEAYTYIKNVNRIYNTILSLTIFLGILALPILFIFLPQYGAFYNGMMVLFLAQLFMSISFGYNCLLVAQKKQNVLAVVSFITLGIVVILSACMGFSGLPFLFQTVVILIGMALYSLQICYAGSRVAKNNFAQIWWKEILPIKILLPVLVLLLILIFDLNHWWGSSAIILFFVLSYEDLSYIFKLAVDKKKHR